MTWKSCFENPLSKGRRELEQEGFTVLRDFGGRWFEVIEPPSRAPTRHVYAMYRTRTGAWHSFAKDARATGSGGSPTQALSGGLGDVIDTDIGVRNYCRGLASAPPSLSRYEGLAAARSSCFNEFGVRP